MQAAVLTDKLTKRYGETIAVRELNLTVPHGTVFGLLGPNGAGKTTTMRILLGLARPTSGRAWVLGKNPADPDTRKPGGIGALIEGPAFYPYLTGRENLELLCTLSGEGDDEVQWALEKVGLADAADRLYEGYSHGMRQRLGIAAALLPRPRLLILDEPASGLDPAGLREVRDLLAELAKEGITIVLSSHLLHEVQQICTHVAIMFSGRLAAVGRVEELLVDEEIWVDVQTDAPERALRVCRRYSSQVRRVNGGQVTAQMPREVIPELTRELVGEGLRIYGIVPRGRTLEDLYMEYASRERDATGA